jgi:hypothetical protein
MPLRIPKGSDDKCVHQASHKHLLSFWIRSKRLGLGLNSLFPYSEYAAGDTCDHRRYIRISANY